MDMEDEAHNERGSEKEAHMKTTAPTLVYNRDSDAHGQPLDLMAWLEGSTLRHFFRPPQR